MQVVYNATFVGILFAINALVVVPPPEGVSVGLPAVENVVYCLVEK